MEPLLSPHLKTLNSSISTNTILAPVMAVDIPFKNSLKVLVETKFAQAEQSGQSLL